MAWHSLAASERGERQASLTSKRAKEGGTGSERTLEEAEDRVGVAIVERDARDLLLDERALRAGLVVCARKRGREERG